MGFFRFSSKSKPPRRVKELVERLAHGFRMYTATKPADDGVFGRTFTYKAILEELGYDPTVAGALSRGSEKQLLGDFALSVYLMTMDDTGDGRAGIMNRGKVVTEIRDVMYELIPEEISTDLDKKVAEWNDPELHKLY